MRVRVIVSLLVSVLVTVSVQAAIASWEERGSVTISVHNGAGKADLFRSLPGEGGTMEIVGGQRNTLPILLVRRASYVWVTYWNAT